jgi:hypothetical protein
MTSIDVAFPELTNSGKGESLIQAMMKPAFYPKPPGEVTHKETHISHLFFAGDLVYKIKKPVRFSRLLDAYEAALLFAAGIAFESTAGTVGLPGRDADRTR